MRHLIRTYTVWELIYQIWDRQTVLIKTKKKRKKTVAFKRCVLLSLSVKPTFVLLDMPTAPGVLQSQWIHTCHRNGFIIRLPLLMIRTKDVLIFWQCLDNDVINLCCGRLPLFVSPIYMSNDHLEPFNYHNIAFKRCADVVSLGRHDRLWFFRHNWLVGEKLGFKAQTCWTELLAFWGVSNQSRILNFRQAIFPVFQSPASRNL